jgi:hypothetical protein
VEWLLSVLFPADLRVPPSLTLPPRTRRRSYSMYPVGSSFPKPGVVEFGAWRVSSLQLVQVTLHCNNWYPTVLLSRKDGIDLAESGDVPRLERIYSDPEYYIGQ